MTSDEDEYEDCSYCWGGRACGFICPKCMGVGKVKKQKPEPDTLHVSISTDVQSGESKVEGYEYSGVDGKVKFPIDVMPPEDELCNKLGEVWNLFLDLPEEHPCDRVEFMQAIHAAQNILMSRVYRRNMPDS